MRNSSVEVCVPHTIVREYMQVRKSRTIGVEGEDGATVGGVKALLSNSGRRSEKGVAPQKQIWHKPTPTVAASVVATRTWRIEIIKVAEACASGIGLEHRATAKSAATIRGPIQGVAR